MGWKLGRNGKDKAFRAGSMTNGTDKVRGGLGRPVGRKTDGEFLRHGLNQLRYAGVHPTDAPRGWLCHQGAMTATFVAPYRPLAPLNTRKSRLTAGSRGMLWPVPVAKMV